MNPLDRLSEYLRGVERRLRVLALTRGAAITLAVALGATVGAVLLANWFAFSEPSVLVSRVLLFLALAFAVGLGLVLPIIRLNARRAARETERRFPDFEERLLTFTERLNDRPSDPFLELLAADTLDVAQRSEPAGIAPRSRLITFASAAAGALMVLLWLGTSGPGFLGYGTSLLWGGIPKGEMKPFYDIVVKPGSKTVRKRSDQNVTARLVGFTSQRVRIYARYDSASKWEQADMGSAPGSPEYEFLFSGLPDSLQYYIEAGGVRSKTFRFNVVDLPGVKRIRVTYHFPGWTGMKDAVEDPGGDLRAVEGTIADVAIQTDKPLTSGALLLDDGSKLPLREAGGRLIASIPINKDGVYHVAAVEGGEDVRLSEDYFIEAKNDGPPTVKVERPGRDAKVSPIEEVTIAVKGQDDFGLKQLTLHYSVNGAPEKDRRSAQGRGAEAGGRRHDLVSGRLSARARRRDQRLRHGQRRAQHHPQRHVFHPGRAFPARVLTIPDGWGRRRGRRRRRSGQPDLCAAEGDHCGHLEPGEG